MSIEKITDKDFTKLTGHRLSNVSLLNLFNILEDTQEREKFLNIFRSYSLNEKIKSNTSFYETYEVDNDDWWDNISYKYYETPALWWVIPLMNDINNPFEEKNEPGDNLKILRGVYLYQLLKEIKIVSST